MNTILQNGTIDKLPVAELTATSSLGQCRLGDSLCACQRILQHLAQRAGWLL
jgi:hypothetical protein